MTDLTPAQIEAMPAGRELDARVLVHVCGWRWWLYKQAKACSLVPPNHPSVEDGTHGPFAGWPDESERFKDWTFSGWVEAPKVSSDIAAAFGVVEAMMKRGYSVFIQFDKLEPNFWACDFGGEVLDGETLPLAICRAALIYIAKESPCRT